MGQRGSETEAKPGLTLGHLDWPLWGPRGSAAPPPGSSVQLLSADDGTQIAN